MKYYHFIMAERPEKCYTSEVVFLRNLLAEDFETYSNLETSFFEAFQALEGESLEGYFAEAEGFFAMVEAQQEQAPLHEEGVAKVVGRNRKSVWFSIAHSLTKAVRLPEDNYQVTFSSCLKLVRQFI